MEVYNDNDKDKLIRNSKENFRIFLSVVTDELNMNDDQIDFINTKEEEQEQEKEEQLFHKENQHYEDSDNVMIGRRRRWERRVIVIIMDKE